jgi:hypothetical protein
MPASPSLGVDGVVPRSVGAQTLPHLPTPLSPRFPHLWGSRRVTPHHSLPAQTPPPSAAPSWASVHVRDQVPTTSLHLYDCCMMMGLQAHFLIKHTAGWKEISHLPPTSTSYYYRPTKQKAPTPSTRPCCLCKYVGFNPDDPLGTTVLAPHGILKNNIYLSHHRHSPGLQNVPGGQEEVLQG